MVFKLISFLVITIGCVNCVTTKKTAGQGSARFPSPGASVEGNQDYHMKSYSEMVRSAFGG